MKNSFAENFLSREKRTSDNSKILHSFRWKCIYLTTKRYAVKESRKNYANFVIFSSQFLGGNPRRRCFIEVFRGLIIKQEELYFRLKSKRYLINNQELTPFSLDNLKMVFHIVRGLFNSRKVENSFVEKENRSRSPAADRSRREDKLTQKYYGFH